MGITSSIPPRSRLGSESLLGRRFFAVLGWIISSSLLRRVGGLSLLRRGVLLSSVRELSQSSTGGGVEPQSLSSSLGVLRVVVRLLELELRRRGGLSSSIFSISLRRSERRGAGSS